MVSRYAVEANGAVSVAVSAAFISGTAHNLMGELMLTPPDIDELIDNADPNVVVRVAEELSKLIDENWPDAKSKPQTEPEKTQQTEPEETTAEA